MSKREATKAFELDLLLRAKLITKWEKQKKISLDVNGCHICNYYIDFIIYHNGGVLDDGITEYCEIKGFETSTWRIKWKLFEALYGSTPNIKLTVER